MSRKQAADYLGLSPKTLAEHASKGTGPDYVNIGRTYYFQRDLDEWIKGRRGSAAAEIRQRKKSKASSSHASPKPAQAPSPI